MRWLAEHGAQDSVNPLVAVLQGEERIVAKLAEAALWQIWSRSGDAETDRLLVQGTLLLSRGAARESIQVFDAVIQRTPGFAEGYNKRATAWYQIGAYERSLDDIDRTLSYNPVHFGALSGAGLCLIGLKRLDAAIGWFDRALRVNPTMDGIRELRDELDARVRKRI